MRWEEKLTKQTPSILKLQRTSWYHVISLTCFRLDCDQNPTVTGAADPLVCRLVVRMCLFGDSSGGDGGGDINEEINVDRNRQIDDWTDTIVLLWEYDVQDIEQVRDALVMVAEHI